MGNLKLKKLSRGLAVALAAVAVWLVFLQIAASGDQRLRDHIVLLGTDEPPSSSIEALRAAGPRGSFEAWLALMRGIVDMPPREWTLSPHDTLEKLVKIHGKRSVEGVNAFLYVLDDSKPVIRWWALHATWRCCGREPAPKETIARVVEALGDKDPEVRQEACQCFVSIHPNWQVGLISCLQHPNPFVRCTAVEALGGRGSQEDRVGRFPDAILPLLDDPDLSVRSATAVALARLGRGNVRVLALLRDSIQDEDSDRRTSACSAIGDMGPAASAAVPDLLACLVDDDKVTRRCAAASLAEIAPAYAAGSEATCGVLLEALEEGGMSGVWAAEAFGRLGGAAPSSAIAALGRASASEHAFLKDAAVRALEKIHARPVEAELQDSRLSIVAKFLQATAKPGDEIVLEVVCAIQSGYHILGGKDPNGATGLELTVHGGLVPIAEPAIPDGVPHSEFGITSFWVEGTAILHQRLLVPKEAFAGAVRVSGCVRYMACTPNSVDPPVKGHFAATVTLLGG